MTADDRTRWPVRARRWPWWRSAARWARWPASASELALPHRPGAFPLATFAINVRGCLLIGVVIVVLTERSTGAHPLARPFLTTGVLGGFTTFSTFATDAEELLRLGHLGSALGYLVGTPVAALTATWVGLG